MFVEQPEGKKNIKSWSKLQNESDDCVKRYVKYIATFELSIEPFYRKALSSEWANEHLKFYINYYDVVMRCRALKPT